MDFPAAPPAGKSMWEVFIADMAMVACLTKYSEEDYKKATETTSQYSD